MLPDDFENLGQSVVASSFCLNNVLAAITTKNYWNLRNNYKPLMHLWYIGILVQAYVVFIFRLFLQNKNKLKALKISVFVLFVVSLLLYWLPSISVGDRFYYLPFRTFEIILGCGVCLFKDPNRVIEKGKATIAYWLLIILMVIVMYLGTPFGPKVNLLIETVLTAVIMFIISHSEESDNRFLNMISVIGIASFSIYIVHQPILAFTRYLFTSQIVNGALVIDIALIVVFSFVFYEIFEKRYPLFIKRIGLIKSFFVTCFACMVVVGCGMLIYLRAGVVRNVPELDISVDNIHRGMHAEYVDVPYAWNRDFTTEKIHILVIGDSMARDWCNILNESAYSDNYEISYVFGSKLGEDYKAKFEQADYIFYATLLDSTEEIPQYLENYIKNDNFYVIGVKNFGESNGQIYQKRHSVHYFDSSIMLGKTSLPSGITFEEQNQKQKEYWGNHYIDMIDPIRNTDGSIPVFTDTNKFISADTEHLTKNGCIYYSKILDLSFIK